MPGTAPSAPMSAKSAVRFAVGHDPGGQGGPDSGQGLEFGRRHGVQVGRPPPPGAGAGGPPWKRRYGPRTPSSFGPMPGTLSRPCEVAEGALGRRGRRGWSGRAPDPTRGRRRRSWREAWSGSIVSPGARGRAAARALSRCAVGEPRRSAGMRATSPGRGRPAGRPGAGCPAPPAPAAGGARIARRSAGSMPGSMPARPPQPGHPRGRTRGPFIAIRASSARRWPPAPAPPSPTTCRLCALTLSGVSSLVCQ